MEKDQKSILSSDKSSETGRFLRRFKLEILSLVVMTLSLLLVTYLSSQRVSFQQQARMNIFSTLQKSLGRFQVEQPQQTLQPPAPEQSSQRLTKNQEIAEKTLKCLSAMKDNQGRYLYGRSCSQTECTQTESNSSGPRPIWALFKHFQITKDSSELQEIRKDLDFNSKVLTLQNDFWNCKLMAELYRSSDFSSQDKELIRKICLTSVYQPPVVQAAKRALANKKIESWDFDSFRTKLQKTKASQTTGTETEAKNLYQNSFYASDMIGKFAFTNDTNDISLAKSFFNTAVNLYSAKKVDLRFKGHLCVMGTAAADLYRATGLNEYLDFARYLWEEEQISPQRFSSYTAKADCAYFASELYQITRENKYKEGRNQFLASLIQNNFDYQGYSGEVRGDGCFNVEINSGRAMKFTSQNALNIGLLLEE